MATPTSSLLSEQQQQQQAGEIWSNSKAVSGSSWGSSGSTESFFAVMSVLVVLAIVSCVVGRMCREGKVEHSMSPILDSIRYRGCFGWLRKWRRFVDGHGHDVGAKVVDFAGKGKNVQAKDGEVEVPRD